MPPNAAASAPAGTIWMLRAVMVPLSSVLDPPATTTVAPVARSVSVASDEDVTRVVEAR